MLDSEAGSGLLSGFESTLWDGGGILPSVIAIRLSPEGPIAFCSSFNTQTAGAAAGNKQKKSGRFGLLAEDCAVEHADIFLAVPPLPEQDFRHPSPNPGP